MLRREGDRAQPGVEKEQGQQDADRDLRPDQQLQVSWASGASCALAWGVGQGGCVQVGVGLRRVPTCPHDHAYTDGKDGLDGPYTGQIRRHGPRRQWGLPGSHLKSQTEVEPGPRAPWTPPSLLSEAPWWW